MNLDQWDDKKKTINLGKNQYSEDNLTLVSGIDNPHDSYLVNLVRQNRCGQAQVVSFGAPCGTEGREYRDREVTTHMRKDNDNDKFIDLL